MWRGSPAFGHLSEVTSVEGFVIAMRSAASAVLVAAVVVSCSSGGRESTSPTTAPTAPIRVYGTMAMVGGPPGAKDTPVRGTVTATDSHGRQFRVAVLNGQFSTGLPTGEYNFVGRTQQWNNGSPCPSVGPIRITARRLLSHRHGPVVAVVCPRE